MERLQKYLSAAGVCSRRKAEELIAEGKIKVNGKVAVIGAQVSGSEVIEVNGKIIPKAKAEPIYIMLNKPRGYITTMSDEQDRNCVAALIEDITERIVPVGRLDRMSEGLLIMTNDGELVNMLTHPSHNIEKRYLVTVRGDVTFEILEKLTSEIVIDDILLKPIEVSVLSREGDRTQLMFVLTEGKNRQIRKICELANVEVMRLKRVALGEIRLAQLKAGKWRHLEPSEVKYLKGLK